MGFGILFFGYFVTFAFSLSSYYFFADVLGALVMCYSFTKLAEYNLYFKKALIPAAAFILLSLTAASQMFFKWYPSGGAVELGVTLAKAVSAAIVHILVFLGMRGISFGADNKKLAGNAEKNLVMTMVYYAGYAAVMTMKFVGAAAAGYFANALLIYFILVLIFNLALIYKCFGTLCPADEDENEVKRSRFAIINKIDDKMDQFEKNTRKYQLDSMKMAMDEADKLAEQKNNKKKKHKKKK